MARKATLESLIKQAESQDSKVSEIEKQLEAAKNKQSELWEKVAQRRNEMEQERFIDLAKVAIKRFGENVTPEKLSEILDTIMINDEVSDYINSEITKQNDSSLANSDNT